MTIGDDGIASICMGKQHVGNPCENCGHVGSRVFVVSGSRRVRSYETVARVMLKAVAKFGFPEKIIEGGQRSYDNEGRVVGGVDYFASVWAMRHNVPCDTENAEWDLYGRKAGPMRNRRMADAGDFLVAIPDQKSRGTADMVTAMKEAGKAKNVFVEFA